MSSYNNFSTASPITISIQNQYQGENLPVIYIIDSHSNTADKLGLVNFKFSPQNSQQLQLTGFNFATPVGKPVPVSAIPALSPSNIKDFSPGEGNCNFYIAFRPGVLSDTLLPTLSDKLQSAISETIPGNPCSVFGPVVRETDGALIWYCALQKTFHLHSEISIELTGISAEPSIGSRSSQIDVHFESVLLNGNPNSMSFTRTAHIDILNHQGRAFAPLYFGVLGENRFINDLGKGVPLSCYFETHGNVPIQFGPKTQFTFSFSYNEGNHPLMHFGSHSKEKGVTWNNTKAAEPYNGAITGNPDFKGLYKLKNTVAEDLQDFTYKLTSKFRLKNKKGIKNPEYAKLVALSANFKQEKKTNWTAYTSTTGAFKLAQSHMTTAKNAINWTTLIANLSSEEFDQIIAPYLPYINTTQQMVSDASTIYSNSHSPFQNSVAEIIETMFTTGAMDSRSFSQSTWDKQYKGICDYLTSKNISTDFLTDTIQGRTSQNSYGSPSTHPNRWIEPKLTDFINFVKLNIANICIGINNVVGSSGTYSGEHQYDIFPSRYLYDFMYDLFIACGYKAQLSPFLLDITNGFTKEQWLTAYNAAKSTFSTKMEIPAIEHYTSRIGSGNINPIDFWLDDDLLTYTNDELTNFIGKHPGHVFTNPITKRHYIIPSASLYYYFNGKYQHNLYKNIIPDTPEYIKSYINPVSCIFNFDDVQFSGRPGTVILHVKAEGIPGYWDTDFQIPIVKEPKILSVIGLEATGQVKAANLKADKAIITNLETNNITASVNATVDTLKVNKATTTQELKVDDVSINGVNVQYITCKDDFSLTVQHIGLSTVSFGYGTGATFLIDSTNGILRLMAQDGCVVDMNDINEPIFTVVMPSGHPGLTTYTFSYYFSSNTLNILLGDNDSEFLSTWVTIYY